MAKHFDLDIAEAALSFKRNAPSITVTTLANAKQQCAFELLRKIPV